MTSTRTSFDEWEAPAAQPRDDEDYRIKLYKVACGAAREKREQLRLEWEARLRERP
jgi:hypothetical protein